MLFKTILLCLHLKKVIFKPPILYNFFYKSWKYARKIPGLSRILHVSGPPRESINKDKGENMKFQGIKETSYPPSLGGPHFIPLYDIANQYLYIRGTGLIPNQQQAALSIKAHLFLVASSKRINLGILTSQISVQ